MRYIFSVILLILIPVALSAHPGKTDKNGGHNGPNGYHYHNGGGNKTTAPSTAPSPNNTTDDFITAEHEIKELQTLLTEFGFYKDQITGVYNEATIKAANEARVKYKVSDAQYDSMVRRSLLIKLKVESIKR